MNFRHRSSSSGLSLPSGPRCFACGLGGEEPEVLAEEPEDCPEPVLPFQFLLFFLPDFCCPVDCEEDVDVDTETVVEEPVLVPFFPEVLPRLEFRVLSRFFSSSRRQYRLSIWRTVCRNAGKSRGVSI